MKGFVGVGSEFPSVELNGVNFDNSLVKVSTSEAVWKIIYFYPKDFTFICPTEIAQMDRAHNDAQVIGISGDNEYCKLAWKQSNDLIKDIRHTLAADPGLQLAMELGVVDQQENVALRATYIVDPNDIIQHVSINALDTGRNVDEVIRTLLALQAGGLTGCGWQQGDDFVA